MKGLNVVYVRDLCNCTSVTAHTLHMRSAFHSYFLVIDVASTYTLFSFLGRGEGVRAANRTAATANNALLEGWMDQRAFGSTTDPD